MPEIITWDDVIAMYDALSEAMPPAETPARMECGRDVPDALISLFGATYPVDHIKPPFTMFGIPIIVRDDMPPDEWVVYAVDGSEMKRGSTR